MDNLGLFESFDSDERIEREAVRSAVVLTKIRYDEQLAPFVKNRQDRLASNLVQDELARIIKECSDEVGADSTTVLERFNQILSDVVLPVSEPEHQDATDVSNDPPEKFEKERPGPVNKVGDPGTTTDVRDHGAVLEEEILSPDYSKTIEVQGNCFRCKTKEASAESPLCWDCENEVILKAAGDESDFLARKEAYPGPMQGTQPVAPQQGTVGPQQPLTPLNPNAPYQCNVCGYTGTFADVQQHVNTASDPQHMQAKQNQHTNYSPQPGSQTAPTAVAAKIAASVESYVEVGQAYSDLGTAVQEQLKDLLDQGPSADANPNAIKLISERFLPALQNYDGEAAEELQYYIQEWFASNQHGGEEDHFANLKFADADAYEDDVHKDEVKIPEQTTDPFNRFREVIQTMANRAAARTLSTPQDSIVQKIADTYGLDPDQIKGSLFITAKFGDYSYTNGQIGEQQPPADYVPLNLDGDQGQGGPSGGDGQNGHQVVVPVSPAIRRVATDLGMDEGSVYASVRDNMGADLSQDYHVSATGMYEVYVPRELMDQSQNHPQPSEPNGNQPNNSLGQQGTPVQPIQPAQPMQNQITTSYHGGPLSQSLLDQLVERDEKVSMHRMARRGYTKIR